MNGAKIRVFKQSDQKSLAGLLERKDRRRLESKVGLEILGDFTHQALEGEPADEEFGGPLVLADLTKCHSSWPVAVGPLHPPGSRRALATSQQPR